MEASLDTPCAITSCGDDGAPESIRGRDCLRPGPLHAARARIDVICSWCETGDLDHPSLTSTRSRSAVGLFLRLPEPEAGGR